MPEPLHALNITLRGKQVNKVTACDPGRVGRSRCGDRACHSYALAPLRPFPLGIARRQKHRQRESPSTCRGVRLETLSLLKQDILKR